jgi:hypothetical protein
MDQSTFIQKRRFAAATYGQQGSDATNRYLDRNGSYVAATIKGRITSNPDCCSPPTAPDPPTGLVAVPIVGRSVSVTFTPGPDGRSPIINYLYSFDGVDFTPFDPPVTGSPIIITDLSAGETYTIYLIAQNDVGYSVPSEFVSVLAADVPEPPTNLVATAGDGSASISFTVGDDGYSPITNYLYSFDGITFIPFDPAVTSSPVTITGLINGTPYTIYLTARNVVGPSVPSSPVSVTPDNPLNLALMYDASLYGSNIDTITSNGVTGTNTGSVKVSKLANNEGVFYFPGSAYYTFPSYNFGNLITVCAWVNPESRTSFNTLIATKLQGSVPTNGFAFGWNNFGSQDRELSCEMANGTAFSKPSTAFNQIVEGTWQHITYVFDNTNTVNTLNFYKNGVLLPNIGESPPANVLVNGVFRIGLMINGTLFMKCQLGYIKVFKSILSDTDILADYDDSKARFGL